MTYSRGIAVAKCGLEIIILDKVCLCSNFGLTLKISPCVCSILLRKKWAPTKILLLLFKIVD